MITIGVSCPRPTDTTSFYRGIGPMAALKRQCKYLNYMMSPVWDWTTMAPLDLFFLQRPYTEDHVKMMEMAQDHRIPVWVDYDDLLLAVPTDNPSYFQFEHTKNTVAKIMADAEVVTVSTEYLAKAVRTIAKGRVVVVPNGLSEQFDSPNHGPRGEKKKVFWRGSRTHQRDVFTHADQIVRLARNPEHAEWEWHWFADNMWFVTDSLPKDRAICYEATDHIVYHQMITKIAPEVFIVPLHLSPFNLAKSNNAWLEATYAGALTLAPDWEEWRRPGIINYKDPEHFMEQLEKVLRGTYPREPRVAQSWSYIQRHLRLRDVNLKRVQVICDTLNVQPHELGVPNATAIEMAQADARKDRGSTQASHALLSGPFNPAP
jgi:hypothetical protein